MYEHIDKNLYTPMMRQYLTIKEEFPDTLVFFRLGDFYEMFFNDAITASKELEIVLTSRDAGTSNERVPMCGVPFHAVEGYIEKLSQLGYKVAIVEQMEAPNNKKIVSREVIKIITPGTNISEQYLSGKDSSYIGCIDKTTLGYSFSYIDLSTGEAFSTLLPNHIDSVYNELQKLSIKEVITSNSFPKLYVDYIENVLNITHSFHDNLNIESYLDNIVIGLENDTKKNALRLLSYIVSTQKRVLIHIKKFTVYNNNDFLKMDVNTVKNLELVESLRGNRFKKNLFSILDKCETAMGSRYLKKNILYPLTNLSSINYRLNILEELLKNYLISNTLTHELQEIYDLERIVGRISYGSLSPKDLLQLKKSLKVLPNIKRILNNTNSKLLNNFSNDISTFNELFEVLENSIREDAPYLLRDGNIIKPGYSEELDKIKNISKTNKDFLTQLETSERLKTGIKSLRVSYNRVFGYYIEVTKSNVPLIKDEYGYIRKQTTSNSERYITEELKEREVLILRSEEHAIQLELELFDEIRNICKNHANELQIVASKISLLDMLLSFMKCSRDNNYTRPQFSLYNEIEIKEGRHPVIEASTEQLFIPNDMSMGNNDLIMLITGPNMSGKSTYMRQTAIIAIMAQIGCYVPACKATLPIFDQIFTRIGSSDDITGGESTFMTEMLEVNYALVNATPKSLILFDEVGRGTATFDGLALAQAIIEYIHDKIGCKTLFSTHYHELTSLNKSLPFLSNVHVNAKEENGQIVFFHKVIEGATDQSYGINVARLANMPISVTLRATDILNKIENKNFYEVELLSKKYYHEPIVVKEIDPLYQSIIQEIIDLNPDELKPVDALMKLIDLKNKVGDNNA